MFLQTSCFNETLIFSKSFLIGSSTVGFSTSLNSDVLSPYLLSNDAKIYKRIGKNKLFAYVLT